MSAERMLDIMVPCASCAYLTARSPTRALRGGRNRQESWRMLSEHNDRIIELPLHYRGVARGERLGTCRTAVLSSGATSC
ncbi:hypothetical protein ACXX9E_05490 [Pseudomonas sp. GNP014]